MDPSNNDLDDIFHPTGNSPEQSNLFGSSSDKRKKQRVNVASEYLMDHSRILQCDETHVSCSMPTHQAFTQQTSCVTQIDDAAMSYVNKRLSPKSTSKKSSKCKKAQKTKVAGDLIQFVIYSLGIILLLLLLVILVIVISILYLITMHCFCYLSTYVKETL